MIMMTLIAVFAPLNVSAVDTYVIDNDDAQGYETSSVGFATYLQDSMLYYGDARRQLSNSPSNGLYTWHYPVRYKQGNFYCGLRVFLYHDTFTDPAASYYGNCANQYYTTLIGRINQNYAPAGWNAIAVTTLEQLGQTGNRSSYVDLRPSGTANCYTGADAIEMRIW